MPAMLAAEYTLDKREPGPSTPREFPPIIPNGSGKLPPPLPTPGGAGADEAGSSLAILALGGVVALDEAADPFDLVDAQ